MTHFFSLKIIENYEKIQFLCEPDDWDALIFAMTFFLFDKQKHKHNAKYVIFG